MTAFTSSFRLEVFLICIVFLSLLRNFVLPQDSSLWVAFSGSVPSLLLIHSVLPEHCEAERDGAPGTRKLYFSATSSYASDSIGVRPVSPLGDEYGERLIARGSGERCDFRGLFRANGASTGTALRKCVIFGVVW